MAKARAALIPCWHCLLLACLHTILPGSGLEFLGGTGGGLGAEPPKGNPWVGLPLSWPPSSPLNYSYSHPSPPK
jgi:hypothetical protein